MFMFLSPCCFLPGMSFPEPLVPTKTPELLMFQKFSFSFVWHHVALVWLSLEVSPHIALTLTTGIVQSFPLNCKLLDSRDTS